MKQLLLSPHMEEAVAHMRQHGGTFVRFPGGYWSWPDCPRRQVGPLLGPPEWHAHTRTIYALIDRDVVEVVSRMARGDPSEVRLP